MLLLEQWQSFSMRDARIAQYLKYAPHSLAAFILHMFVSFVVY